MKPNWEDAPSWANYLAMNEDGNWFWWEFQPEKDWHGPMFGWCDGIRSEHAGYPNINWYESLEKRP